MIAAHRRFFDGGAKPQHMSMFAISEVIESGEAVNMDALHIKDALAMLILRLLLLIRIVNLTHENGHGWEVSHCHVNASWSSSNSKQDRSISLDLEWAMLTFLSVDVSRDGVVAAGGLKHTSEKHIGGEEFDINMSGHCSIPSRWKIATMSFKWNSENGVSTRFNFL